MASNEILVTRNDDENMIIMALQRTLQILEKVTKIFIPRTAVLTTISMIHSKSFLDLLVGVLSSASKVAGVMVIIMLDEYFTSKVLPQRRIIAPF